MIPWSAIKMENEFNHEQHLNIFFFILKTTHIIYTIFILMLAGLLRRKRVSCTMYRSVFCANKIYLPTYL